MKGTHRAVWTLVGSNRQYVAIRDEDGDKSITNDVDAVVQQLAPALRGRRLFYIDTTGRVDEIVVMGGRFHAFAPGASSWGEWSGSSFLTTGEDLEVAR